MASFLGLALLPGWLGPFADVIQPRPTVQTKPTEDLARKLCSTCHPFPKPDILPRALWRREVEKMALIMERKPIPARGEPSATVARSDQLQKVVAYYEAAAPAMLAPLEIWPAPSDAPVWFARRSIDVASALTREPAEGKASWADLFKG